MITLLQFLKEIALPATVPNEAQGDWEQVKAAMEA